MGKTIKGKPQKNKGVIITRNTIEKAFNQGEHGARRRTMIHTGKKYRQKYKISRLTIDTV